MNRSGNILPKIGLVVFFIFLVTITALPMLFYMSKKTKNPVEFKQQERLYVDVKAIAMGVPPQIAPYVKSGDTQKDYNGEPNMTIVKVVKVSPVVIGTIVGDDGKETAILSPSKDIELVVKVRYYKSGDDILCQPGGPDLKAGISFSFKTQEYVLHTVNVIEVPKTNG